MALERILRKRRPVFPPDGSGPFTESVYKLCYFCCSVTKQFPISILCLDFLTGSEDLLRPHHRRIAFGPIYFEQLTSASADFNQLNKPHSLTGSEDLFVHQTSILAEGFRSLKEGEPVEFTVGSGDDGRVKALDVTGPGGVPVQGAPREEMR